MNRILKVAKWQLRDSRKAILIFYGIVLSVVGLIALTNWLYGSGQGKAGGLDANEVVFCFVFGLNSFTTAFKFSQANNVSRRSLFIGSLLSLTSIAFLLAVISVIFSLVLRSVMPYENMVTQLYRTDAILTSLVWSFALNTFAMFLGWLITMIYYRSNKLQKLLVSLSPAILVFSLVLLARTSIGGMVFNPLIRAIRNALGFADLLNPNPHVAAFSFFVGAACLAALNFSLIRRAPIRE